VVSRQQVFAGRVIFDHLPKTAGQAVNAWLRDHLGESIVTPNLIGRHRELINRYGGAYSVISGHIAFKGEGLDPRYQYVACLRDPIDRAISWLYFVLKNHTAADLPEKWIAAEAFIQSDGLWEVADEFLRTSGSSKRLLGVFNEIGHHINNATVEHFSAVLPGRAGNDYDKLSRALQAVEQYDLLGFYDDLAKFTNDLATLLCLPAVQPVQKVNVTSQRPNVAQLSPLLKKNLELLNELDLEFYQILDRKIRSEKYTNSSLLDDHTLILRSDHLIAHASTSDDFCLLGLKISPDKVINYGQPSVLEVSFSTAQYWKSFDCVIQFFDSQERLVFGTTYSSIQGQYLDISPGTHLLQLAIQLNLPSDNYFISLIFKGDSPFGLATIVDFDRILSFSIPYVRASKQIGRYPLLVTAACAEISSAVVSKVHDGKGELVAEADLASLQVGRQYTVQLKLNNISVQDWVSTYEHPINISYRWITPTGDKVEGRRTPLMVKTVGAACSLVQAITFDVPNESGRYQLEILPVQEKNCWFDVIDFLPWSKTVDVFDCSLARIYRANHPDIHTQVGQLKQGSLHSTAAAGYLFYGPYTELQVGFWQARFVGEFASAFNAIDLDVVSAGGAIISEIVCQLDQTNELIINFCLSELTDKIEVRLWVQEEAFARVDYLDIRPMNDRGV
jgi:hypothetical protein